MIDSTDKEMKPVANVGTQRVARTYAEALLNAADKHQQADAVLEELDSLIRDVFKAIPLLEASLNSPAISRTTKEHLIHTALDHRATDVFRNFILVLNKHDRLDLLRPILVAALQVRDERAKRMRVLVRTATPMPDDQRQRLTDQLRQSFQREPVLETQVDPALLGGMIVRVDDWRYDGSVRTKLENLKKQLIERSSYEIQSRRDRFCSANGN